MAIAGPIIFFLLVAMFASVIVRFFAALLSDRIWNSVARHPFGHMLWLVGGLVALLLLDRKSVV